MNKVSHTFKILTLTYLTILLGASLLVIFGTTNTATAQTKITQERNFRLTFRGTEVDPATCSRTGSWAATGVGAGPTTVSFPAFSLAPGVHNFGYSCASLPSSSQGGAVISTPNVQVEILPADVNLAFGGTGSTNPYYVAPNLTFTSGTGVSANYHERYSIYWNFTGSASLIGGNCTLKRFSTTLKSDLPASGSYSVYNNNEICQEPIGITFNISCTSPNMTNPITLPLQVTHQGKYNCVPL